MLAAGSSGARQIGERWLMGLGWVVFLLGGVSLKIGAGFKGNNISF